MKAIVIRQPWATLVMLGVKTIETRGFPPNGPMRPDGVRGLPGLAIERGERIAIVAGAKAPEQGLRLGAAGPIVTAEYLVDGGLLLELCNEQSWPLPLGSVLGTVRVDDALPIAAPMTDPPCDHLVPTSDGHLMWWKFTPVLGQRRWSAASRHPMLNERTVVGARRDPDLDPQLPLGDFTPGRWGWLLSDPQPIREGWCEADAVGHPTLRLVRWAVGDWTLEGLAPGEWRTA